MLIAELITRLVNEWAGNILSKYLGKQVMRFVVQKLLDAEFCAARIHLGTSRRVVEVAALTWMRVMM